MTVGLTLALLLLLGAIPALGVTRFVTNTDDSGSGSLRDTMAAAQDGDIIAFNLSLPATITVATPLTFSSSVNILGAGPALLHISGGDTAGPVFIVNAGSFVEIARVRILDGDGVTGGGIFNAGNLTLTSSEVTSNQAQLGGGIFNAGALTLLNSLVNGNLVIRQHAGDDFEHENRARGGGIYNFGSSGGTVSLINSSVTGNNGGQFGVQGIEFDGDGNGIYNDHGSVSLLDSTVAQNGSTVNGGSTGWGGGIFNSGGLVLNRATVSNNIADEGGGVYTNFGSMTSVNSTIADNIAGLFGGGVLASFQQGTGSGTGTSILVNTTIARNLAVFDGGGLFANSTVASTTLKNSIVANNNAGTGRNCDIGSGVVSQGHNLSNDTSCADAFTGTGDLNDVDAGLDTSLKNNGGPTETIALIEGSAAIDAVPVGDCTDPNGHALGIDQRKVPRPQGIACDIGAYEHVCSDFVVACVQIFEVAANVDTLRLRNKGTKRGLVAKLEAAVGSLNVDDTSSAINQLGSFINHTDVLVQQGNLTEEQGTALTTPTQDIIDGLQSGG
jgi:hypothetical protein